MEDLVDYYDNYWNDPKDSGGNTITYSFDANHVTDFTRRKGWGQGKVQVKYDSSIPQTSVSTGELVEAEHLNTVIAQVNAGLYHIDNSSSLLSHLPTPNKVIELQDLATVRTKIQQDLDPSKFTCVDDAELDWYVNTQTHNGQVQTWSDDLVVEQKFTFNDYTHARHFFNAGGQLTLVLDTDRDVELQADSNLGYGVTSTSTPGNVLSEIWDYIFDAIGWIGIGAEQTKAHNGRAWDSVTGDQHPLNRVLVQPYGFYSIPNTGNYTNIFLVSGSDSGNTFEYSAGDYNQRQVKVDAKAVETATTFEIHVKVTLIEDVLDYWPINSVINLHSGYKQPLDSPDYQDTNINRTNITGIPGAKQYIFTEIAHPTVSNITPWTLVNV